MTARPLPRKVSRLRADRSFSAQMMCLHLADYHLESARLQLARRNPDKAREHWETAKDMIERMGYHRRDNEATELAEQLG